MTQSILACSNCSWRSLPSCSVPRQRVHPRRSLPPRCCARPFGPGALYSRTGLKAMETVEEINAGGFLGKHPIRLFVRDTLTQPAPAVQKVRELIKDDKVKVRARYLLQCGRDCHQPVCKGARGAPPHPSTSRKISPRTTSAVHLLRGPNTYMQARTHNDVEAVEGQELEDVRDPGIGLRVGTVNPVELRGSP